MSESKQHHALVELIIEETTKIVGDEYSCFIESDIEDGHPLPSLTAEGFRPDVFYQYRDTMIIGDAKTSEDVERPHSISQYNSYLKKCSSFGGRAILIIAVPLTEYALAYNLIHRLKKQFPGDCEIKIIKGIGI